MLKKCTSMTSHSMSPSADDLLLKIMVLRFSSVGTEIRCINFNYRMACQKFILRQLIFYLAIDKQLMCVGVCSFPNFLPLQW